MTPHDPVGLITSCCRRLGGWGVAASGVANTPSQAEDINIAKQAKAAIGTIRLAALSVQAASIGAST